MRIVGHHQLDPLLQGLEGHGFSASRQRGLRAVTVQAGGLDQQRTHAGPFAIDLGQHCRQVFLRHDPLASLGPADQLEIAAAAVAMTGGAGIEKDRLDAGAEKGLAIGT